jgi:hypothetical protein
VDRAESLGAISATWGVVGEPAGIAIGGYIVGSWLGSNIFNSLSK